MEHSGAAEALLDPLQLHARAGGGAGEEHVVGGAGESAVDGHGRAFR